MPSRWDPSGVIAQLYDAAAGLGSWPEAIRTLSDSLGAQSAMLFTPTEPADRFQAGERAPFTGGIVATGDDLAPTSVLELSRWCGDFLKRLDAFHLLGSRVSSERHPLLPRIHLNLFRPIIAPRFAGDERRKRAWLRPHIERALVIGTRMAAAESRANALADVVERMSVAVLLLKSGGRLHHANRAARMILAAEDGLQFGARGLRAQSRADDTQLQRALAAAGTEGPVDPAATACLVSRPSGRRPLQIVAAPVSARNSFAPGERAGAIVFILDPESAADVPTTRVARLLGLTAAEARLAGALAQGISLAEYAARAGITENTARWTLKQALAKTGTEKQGALIALVLKTAMVRSGD